MKPEKREFLHSLEHVTMPFSMRDLEVALNIYVWLVYNDFTFEDLRENIDYIRNAKRKNHINLFTVGSRPPYENLPYDVMKALQPTIRALKNGDLTPEELIDTYRLERKRVLAQPKYGRRRCIKCEREQWPWEVLR